jgi:hypothetical protein
MSQHTPKTRAIVTPAKPAVAPKPKGALPAGKAAPRTVAGKASKPSPGATPAKSAAEPKAKLIRDSFTIPKAEYMVLESLKLRAAKLARPSKKSEVLRAGIGALHAMSDKALLAALGAVPSLKTGRPKNKPPLAPAK